MSDKEHEFRPESREIALYGVASSLASALGTLIHATNSLDQAGLYGDEIEEAKAALRKAQEAL